MIKLASKSPAVINCTVNKSKQVAILKILIFTRTSMTRQHTLFSDESRFSLCFSDGRYRVYRSRGERFTDQCVHESDRFGGGSVMMWAGICHDGRTQLKIVQGTLNAGKYRDDILVGCCAPRAQVPHAAPVVFPVDVDGGEHVYRVNSINVQLVTDPVIMPPRM